MTSDLGNKFWRGNSKSFLRKGQLVTKLGQSRILIITQPSLNIIPLLIHKSEGFRDASDLLSFQEWAQQSWKLVVSSAWNSGVLTFSSICNCCYNIIAPRSRSRGMRSNKGRKGAYKCVCVCASVWEWAESCPHDSYGKSLRQKITAAETWLLNPVGSLTADCYISKSWLFNIGMELTYFQGLPCILSTSTHQLMPPKKVAISWGINQNYPHCSYSLPTSNAGLSNVDGSLLKILLCMALIGSPGISEGIRSQGVGRKVS